MALRSKLDEGMRIIWPEQGDKYDVYMEGGFVPLNGNSRQGLVHISC